MRASYHGIKTEVCQQAPARTAVRSAEIAMRAVRADGHQAGARARTGDPVAAAFHRRLIIYR